MPSEYSFLLQTGMPFDLVREEALRIWITRETNREIQLPYDQMIRIRDQINNHPEKLQWALDVGNGWKLRRNGNTLGIVKGERGGGVKLPWIIMQPEQFSSQSDDHDIECIVDTHNLCFSLSQFTEHSSMKIEQVKDCGNLSFLPPWRKGRTAIKVKQFLRGQKVPLHRRDEAFVLCITGVSSRYALAVYLEEVDGGDRWIVNAEYSPKDESPLTNIVLGKIAQNT